MPEPKKLEVNYHIIIIFPFNGMTPGGASHDILKKLVQLCKKITAENRIVIVYDKKSKGQNNQDILKELSKQNIPIKYAYSVDTCQSWLTGWGYHLDQIEKNNIQEEHNRIILLPGDLENIEDEFNYFKKLEEFIRGNDAEFILGDFDGSDQQGTKELIDLYGINPMIANWFPEAWKAIKKLKLKRTRTEFTNIEAKTLQQFLKSRAFAYAQTLNMLIVQWSQCKGEKNEQLDVTAKKWEDKIKVIHLGTIKDDTRGRYYKGAIDQIERTERMLRMLWRDYKKWDDNLPPDEFETIANKYETKSKRSTSIRDAARIAIWAQMQ